MFPKFLELSAHQCYEYLARWIWYNHQNRRIRSLGRFFYGTEPCNHSFHENDEWYITIKSIPNQFTKWKTFGFMYFWNLKHSLKRCVIWWVNDESFSQKMCEIWALLLSSMYFELFQQQQKAHTHQPSVLVFDWNKKRHTDQSLTLIRIRQTFIQNPFRFPCSLSLSSGCSFFSFFFVRRKKQQIWSTSFYFTWLKYIWFNWISREIGFLC